MDYLGLFCLGCFVGSIALVGLQFMTNSAKWKEGMTAMILATLSGSAVLFVDKFRNSPAIGAYPLGLLIALLWTYATVAIKNIRDDHRHIRVLGWLHMAGVVLINILAAALILPRAWAEVLKALRTAQG